MNAATADLSYELRDALLDSLLRQLSDISDKIADLEIIRQGILAKVEAIRADIDAAVQPPPAPAPAVAPLPLPKRPARPPLQPAAERVGRRGPVPLDYSAVGAAMREAIATGVPIRPFVEQQFGFTRRKAENYLIRARLADPTIPSAPNGYRRPEKYPIDEVCAVMRQALAEGVPIRRALRERFDLGEAMAAKLMTRARRHDPTIPASKVGRPLKPRPLRPPSTTKPGGGTSRTYDYDEVGRIIRQAIADDVAVYSRLEERFAPISKPMLGQLVFQTRRRDPSLPAVPRRGGQRGVRLDGPITEETDVISLEAKVRMSAVRAHERYDRVVDEIIKVAPSRLAECDKPADDIPPKDTPRRKGPVSKYDWAEVAAIVRHAIADGKPVGAALVARYGISKASTNDVLKRCRAAGYEFPDLRGAPRARRPWRADETGQRSQRVVAPLQLVPKLPSEPIPDLTLDGDDTDDGEPDVGYEAVAEEYLRLQAGDSPVLLLRQLATSFEISRVTASRWVRVCRERGLLPGRDEPQIERSAPQGAVVHRSGHGGIGGISI